MPRLEFGNEQDLSKGLTSIRKSTKNEELLRRYSISRLYAESQGIGRSCFKLAGYQFPLSGSLSSDWLRSMMKLRR